MRLRHITPIFVLIHLSGLGLAADLPKLPNNKLLEGDARELPHATPIDCGNGRDRKVKVSKARKPSQVLTPAIFESNAITTGPTGAMGIPRPETISKFKFAEIHGEKLMYGLQVHKSGESAYWLPQGGSIDIPHKPKAKEPQMLFTPDMSGCSLTVTPMANGMLRMRHVEGGKEGPQFNNLTPAQKGGTTTYAMQYKDYAYIPERGHPHNLISHVPAFVYFHFSGGHWTLYIQHQTCAPSTGGYKFNRKKYLTEVMLRETHSTYPPISGTKSYRIP